MADRWLELAGNENARDLGGVPLAAGGTTRDGVLFRSDTLQGLTPDDVSRLVDGYGLRTVVDLRTPLEAEREGRGPLAGRGLGYHNLPFLPDHVVVADHPDHQLIVAERREQDRVDHYLDYLRLAPTKVTGALAALADGSPAIFHCAAGKDRTGVLAALVLDIAGAEREAVVADYVLTNERLGRIRERLMSSDTYRDDVSQRSTQDLACDPDVMRDVLAALDEQYGGAAGWATAHGLSDDRLAALRALLT